MNKIDNVDFHNLENQKYWSFPASYNTERKKTETQQMIFGNEYIGARKMDGAFYKFIKDNNGNMELLGRSKSVKGDYLDKIKWVPQLKVFFDSLPNGTCLLGEIYFPNNEGSHNVTTIMGCLESRAIDRQEKGEKLHYYVFDILAFNGVSLYKKDILYRLNFLKQLKDYQTNYIEIANYMEGKELWDNLQTILANGGEGIVITKKVLAINQVSAQQDKR